jgi:serine phosphatase RsbU (regulator of sigma subunit)
MDMFGPASRRRDRMRYLRHLPWGQRVWLFAAVFFTFSTIGFLTDLMRLSALRPAPIVLVSATVSGVIACLYLLSGMYGMRYIPLAVAAQIGLMAMVTGMYGAARRAAGPAAATVEAMASHARFDATGVLVCIIAGYAMFITFISRLGMRQVRLDTEIALAQEIHASLVPPISRRVGALEIVGRSLPSSEVGGDLIDLVEKDGEALALVADVSGHGVHAGTLMAMVRSAVRVRAATSLELPGMMRVLDDVLIELGRPDKFVTAAALRFGKSASGAIAWAGAPVAEAEAMLAGHLPILVVRAATGAIERIENQRPPLGLPRPAAVARVRYASGDLFAILTDGLTEVSDDDGRHLGLEAIERVLVERRAEPLEAIAAAVFERARAYGPADDDRTLLLVRAD